MLSAVTCDLKLGKIDKIQAISPQLLLCSEWFLPYGACGLTPAPGPHQGSQVERVAQPALEGGYLLTNPHVSIADVIERFSRCSKNPGLAKSRAGGCLTV